MDEPVTQRHFPQLQAWPHRRKRWVLTEAAQARSSRGPHGRAGGRDPRLLGGFFAGSYAGQVSSPEILRQGPRSFEPPPHVDMLAQEFLSSIRRRAGEGMFAN